MEKEYVPQIQISANDPVCSTSSLEGTIVGILFEKKGLEIKKAIGVRLGLIDKKITEYGSIAEKTETFIEEKRKVLKDLDILYQDRSDEKKAFLLPFKRELEGIVKKAEDKVFGYDKETYKKLGEQAVVFEEGFEKFKKNFDALDDFLKKEKDVIQGDTSIFRGIQGATGAQGLGMQGSHDGSTGACGITGSAGNLGLGLTNPEEILELISDDEDKAVARLYTLRDLLKKNVNKLENLKIGIKKLKDEKRRLTLINMHLDDGRLYKLDLNKLSAFGFEDIESE